MVKGRAAGDLIHKVAFYQRVETKDGAGNTVGDWQEEFRCRAAFTHMRGGEAVMAGRLQGRHTIIITVRASSLTRRVATDWQARDARTETAYNIRDITPSDDRQWLDFLCESGVAT